MESLENEILRLKSELHRTESEWQNRSAELEFALEENRIHDKQVYDQNTEQLRQDVHAAQSNLDQCRTVIERNGMNAGMLW